MRMRRCRNPNQSGARHPLGAGRGEEGGVGGKGKKGDWKWGRVMPSSARVDPRDPERRGSGATRREERLRAWAGGQASMQDAQQKRSEDELRLRDASWEREWEEKENKDWEFEAGKARRHRHNKNRSEKGGLRGKERNGEYKLRCAECRRTVTGRASPTVARTRCSSRSATVLRGREHRR